MCTGYDTISLATSAIDNTTMIVPTGFLPFGSAHGDSMVPTALDGSTGEIQLETDIILFGSGQNRLYVSFTLFKSIYIY
jgi:hypothetical protein